MARPGYTLPGVPTLHAGNATSAFVPTLTYHAASGAVSYKYGILDGPAQPHPMTARRDTQMDTGKAARAAQGSARSSDDPYDVWWTDDYNLTNYGAGWTAERPGAGMPVRYYDPAYAGPTTVLPVPATDYRAQYQVDSARITRRAILQRFKSLPWFPRVYERQTGTWNG